jgi:aminoglycoside phosphotransferase (APT) family kinase protein
MNSIYEIGDEHLLRIPLDIPEATRCIVEEAHVLPLLEHHGIDAPRLVAFDDSRELVDVPYTIYRRVHGESMDWWEVRNERSPGLYRAIGAELATLHVNVTEVHCGPDLLATPTRTDPAELLAIPRLPLPARRWIERCLDYLSVFVEDRPTPRFLHADVRPGNTIVRDGRLAALIDWGSAGWGDPALEFSALWSWAVPHALEGYRSVAPLDHHAEARIVWEHLIRVLALEGAIDVLRGVDWVVASASNAPDWMRAWLP